MIGIKFKEKYLGKAQLNNDLLVLSVFGSLCGVLSGLVMVLFYTLIYLPAEYFMAGDYDGFESLPVLDRVAFVWVSCAMLALMFSTLPNRILKVGVPYIIERLNHHQGLLSLSNALVQFVSAVIGLAGGLSIGKEGPAAHLGATLGSYLAQKAKLPQYGVETLLACGVAGAISAGFQTPLAGVLFAFEVIFLEYRLRYVLPILLSSVIAMLISDYALGPLNFFGVSDLVVVNFTPDLFFTCFCLALFVVFLASLFFRIQKRLWRYNVQSVWLRFLVVALATSLAAIYLPEALGSGYDSLEGLLSGDVVVYSLLLLIVAKTVLTALTIGLGIPGGMIGPTFIIGGLAGVQIALSFDTGLSGGGEIALFALLGMAAMMAACFQAPLTALVAIIEMTHSSEVIVPALFVIVVACLFIRTLLGQDSIFVERLRFAGVSSTISPFQRQLRHHKVKPILDEVLILPMLVPIKQVKGLASSMLEYVVFDGAGEWYFVKRMVVLEALKQAEFGPQAWMRFSQDALCMDLVEAVSPAALPLIDEPASLEEVLNWFQQTNRAEVLVALSNTSSLYIVTRRRLDEFLLRDS
ncbi:chloride channel protein [Marinomonas transparens]|uniref:chloride channel protein n=1 Tax=Marinomonas transparens TaxID=2795388 RepID=UPI001F241289|nr:chloride channel protein [Marinomonas transparens]